MTESLTFESMDAFQALLWEFYKDNLNFEVILKYMHVGKMVYGSAYVRYIVFEFVGGLQILRYL